MFKSLKLGTRIALGFSVLIVLAGGLGAVAVWNMQRVETHAQNLTNEAVPMVTAANGVERHSLLTMYAMRAYGLTGEQQHLATGREELAQVDKSLQECTALADKYGIAKLKENSDGCTEAVDSYEALVEETVKATAAIDENRKSLDSSASAYMENCVEFLAGQNAKFKKDLSERQEKIRRVSSIVDLGTTTRVLNFKSQATGDLTLLEQAIANLEGVQEETKKLRPITKLEADIKRIDKTETAADAYGKGDAGVPHHRPLARVTAAGDGSERQGLCRELCRVAQGAAGKAETRAQGQGCQHGRTFAEDLFGQHDDREGQRRSGAQFQSTGRQ